MKEIWKKEGSEISSSEVARLTQKAVEKAESAETPLSDSLDAYGDYAKDRFPMTNDDTLREDFAKKVLVDGYDWIEQSSASNSRGEEVQLRMNEQVNEKYQRIKKKRRGPE